MSVVIIGGGIGGLTFALSCFDAGVDCTVYESAPVIEPLGVGLNLLPHGVRVLDRLGLGERLARAGIETGELAFYTARGQYVHREPRGRAAGYAWPQVSIHRGRLQQLLFEAVSERLGTDAVQLDHRCVGFDQDGETVTVHFTSKAGAPQPDVQGSLVVACDGIRSDVRTLLASASDAALRRPDPNHHTSFRGTTWAPPFLGGRTMVYIGSRTSGRAIIYPVVDEVAEKGRQLINWVAAPSSETTEPLEGDEIAEWTQPAQLSEFIDGFEAWTFDWLDVPALFGAAETIYKTPFVDQDPISTWSEGRVCLLGDAAHPMLPSGSNGSAQAMLDAECLARHLAARHDELDAVKAYQHERQPAVADVVLANRSFSPPWLLDLVDERTHGAPFDSIEDVISADEVRQWQDRYRKIAGFDVETLGAPMANGAT